MEKLELRHLAGYLPYSPKAIMNIFGDNETIVTIVGANHEEVELEGIRETITDWFEYSDIKPILRPLSDLTKEIEVNGKKIIPFDELEFFYKYFYFGIGNENELVVKYKNTNMYVDIENYHNIIEKLYEWHFDIFGLIEKGLAIDINTLNK